MSFSTFLVGKNHLPLQFKESVVKMFNVAIVSSISIPFPKAWYTQCFALLGGEISTNICLAFVR
jgi:hypothetical protein